MADNLRVQYDDGEICPVSEFAILPSGRIVVMVEHNGPESYWFEPDGTNPRSTLLGLPEANKDNDGKASIASEVQLLRAALLFYAQRGVEDEPGQIARRILMQGATNG
jgi:hypothetical protein